MKRENEGWTTRLYRRLLRLYPRAFRERHGEEMARLFRERDEQCALAGGKWRFRIGAALDAIQNGIGERLSGGRYEGLQLQAHTHRASRHVISPDVRANRMDGVWRDLSFAVRVLVRAPRFTLPALTLLVLGIGSTTAIFSVAYTVLVRPLPYREAHRLVYLAEKGGSGIAWPNFEDWRSRAGSFEDLASSLADAVIVTSGPVPRRFESLSVTSNFFRVLGVTPVQGRVFDDPDARPNADAIGQQLIQGRPSEPYGPWRTIVGVVADVKQLGVDMEPPAQVYMPIVQQPRTTVIAIARTRGPMSASTLAAAIHDLDRTIPVFDERTVDQAMRDASSRRRIAMVVLSVFGAVAVLLAAIGLYGVIAQAVAERRQEIGVRMALGATRGQVLRLFLRHGLIVVAVGITIGIAASMAAVRSLASLVFGVTVTDPATLGAVAALLTVVTLLACYLPARSATRVDPLQALRGE